MFSRAGKSTNNLYLAFQDKERLNAVQSKVAAFLGKSSEGDKSEQVNAQIDALRNIMSDENK